MTHAVLLIRSLNYGGTERQLVALAKGLHERGHSVGVAVFYPGGLLEKDLREAGIPVLALDKRGRWDVLGFLLRLTRLLREERPDILHSYLVEPNLVTVMLKLLFPRIKMVWGVRASNVDLRNYDWFARMTFRLECLFSRFPDLIIVNSQAGRRYHLAHGFPKEKMLVIPNGIDTDRFCPDPEARRRVRAEWGVSGDEKLIGLVGRLDPIKDHPTFLKAAALLAQEREGVRFVCVGDGLADYRQELHKLGQELGLTERLIWAGACDDMPAVYNALDIASSSSYGEGFPNVIGEAMACGVPCVVTDVGDSASIVGDAGVVVPPKNHHALADGWRDMLRRLGDHRLSLSEKARARVALHFDLDTLVQKTSDLLKGLL